MTASLSGGDGDAAAQTRAALAAGYGLRRFVKPYDRFMPLLMTSAEGGMLGYALYALLCGADVIALDEPFKGLDESTKRQAVEFSREMLRGRTAVLVTHDRTEAVALADEVIEL